MSRTPLSPRRPLLAAVLLALTLMVATASPASAATWRVPAPDYDRNPLVALDEYEVRLVLAINKRRANRGGPKVRRFDGCLEKKAESWARKLARAQERRHRRLTPVLDDCRVWWVGETLAFTKRAAPVKVVDAWMASSAHRRIILKPRANLAGVGVRRGDDGLLYIVVNLGDR